MESGLREILELEGVTACLLLDNQGQLLQDVSQEEGSHDSHELIGSIAVQTLASLKSRGGKCTQMDYIFDRYRVLVHDLLKAVLVVICQPSVDISLLRLTMSVVTDRWDEDPKTRQYFDDHAKERLAGEFVANGTER